MSAILGLYMAPITDLEPSVMTHIGSVFSLGLPVIGSVLCRLDP
jgi:hypothetical protein